MVIITFGGTPGSGKGTVGKELAKKLDLPFFSMGDLRRQYALDRGMTIAELNMLSEKDPTNDNMVDEYQSTFPKKYPSFIMDSRLGYHFLPTAIKIFLKVDVVEAARRIMNAARDSEKMESLAQAVVAVEDRISSDLRRYEQYYNINPYDESQYDLVINTTNLTPEQALDIIVEYLGQQGVKIVN